MAIGTGTGQSFPVIVGMTAYTGLIKSQIGEFFLFDIGFLNKCGFMAIVAFLFGMCTLQPEPGQAVIEGFGIEFNNLKIPAMVIVVAFNTVFAFYCDRGMISFSDIDPCFQFGMTSQAFGIGNLFPKFMAFGTVRHPLQVCMCLHQFSGRNLCKQGEPEK